MKMVLTKPHYLLKPGQERVKQFVLHLIRQGAVFTGRLIGRACLKITLEGRQNLPGPEAIILISNHFSWFDAPVLTLFLPFQPVFLVATESQNRWFVRLFMNLFHGIPIWRGQVDRQAIRKALHVLGQGGVLGIFPEGGIDPELAARVSRGEMITNISNHASRLNARLVRPRSGVALLAVRSKARILPVGLIGTEKIMANLKRLRRTPVTLRVGPAVGPLTIDPRLRGPARRQQLDSLADLMMQQIARLFPPEKRGPYRRLPPGAGERL